MRIGIKSVSMDDIAREIGISKKTIYKHFKDKKELVLKVVEFENRNEVEACNKCSNTDGNAVQKMIDISRHCLLYTSPSPRDRTRSRMPSSA